MKKIFALLTGLLMITTITFSAKASESSLTPDDNLASMLKPIMPAVVNVAAQGEVWLPRRDDRNQSADPENQPHGKLREFASLGSGVIVDSQKGYILTNAHVIAKAKTITVTLKDGRHFKAKLIGSDAATDIAVIQITAQQLSAMPLGNSDNLAVGDFVAAIGNPFGLNQTVTSGIVSALGRATLGIEGAQGVEDFIQTDASINPGNSGGALINKQGQLVGINTAILTPAGGNIGIGFAVPINMARTIMQQLIQYGSVKRGLMGVIVQDLTPDLAEALGVKSTQGAIIAQVTPNSPAADAGLKAGDIIETVNSKTVLDASQVRNTVGVLRVGATIQLQILRQGQTLPITLTTADPEKYLEAAHQKNPLLFGLALRNFDQEMPLQGHIHGVQILQISKNSAAWRAGLIPGDVILSVNQTPIQSIEQLTTTAANNKKRLLLNIVRRNEAIFVVVS